MATPSTLTVTIRAGTDPLPPVPSLAEILRPIADGFAQQMAAVNGIAKAVNQGDGRLFWAVEQLAKGLDDDGEGGDDG